MPDDVAGELLQLVDPCGRVRGAATRAACHADPGLVHLSVYVLVVTPDGPVWQLRGPRKDVEPSVWDVACSGHVGAGEDIGAAAVRELREELGLEVALDRLALLGRRLARLPHETELVFIYRVEHGGPFTVTPPEVAGVTVMPPAERPSPMSRSSGELLDWLDHERPEWPFPSQRSA